MINERILIIDGDIRASTLLKSRIEAMGYLVEQAAAFEEALYFLRMKWFDLIILDSQLKGRHNGISLLMELKRKKALANVPIIAQSDKARFRKTFELMGVSSFFMKPYVVDAILEEVKDILTNKILVSGEQSGVRKSIENTLSYLDVRVDIAAKLSEFYYDVITYRYKIIIMEYRLRPNITDRMLTVAKSTPKNREAPLIIYSAKNIMLLGQEEKRKLQSLKDRSAAIGRCQLMAGKFSAKDFNSAINSFLGIDI